TEKQQLDKAYKTAKEFDILKPDDLGTIYHALNIHSPILTEKKKVESWAVGALLGFAGKGDRLAASILRYRSFNKIKKSYYDNIAGFADSKNVLHCNIVQAGAKTGRVSASDPNLQNLPKQENLEKIWSAEDLTKPEIAAALRAGLADLKTVSGEDMPFTTSLEELSALSEVRGAFVPRSGHGLLLADWSQIELRIFAYYAQEEIMKRAFEYGIDIHKVTAYAALGPKPTDPAAAKRWRNDGKTFNFGLIYGMGEELLATKTNSTVKEAKGFIESYFRRFPRAKRFRDSVQNRLRERIEATCWDHVYFDFCDDECPQRDRMRGWIRNLWGRRRLLGDCY
ncbi:hypothetical protein LCGC14_3139570, partial [marine sediment metagenome]